MFSSLMTGKGPDKHPKYPGDSFPGIDVICTLSWRKQTSDVGLFCPEGRKLTFTDSPFIYWS